MADRAVDKKETGAGARQAAAPRGQFPAFDLDSSIRVAEAIRNEGGGRTNRDHLASFLLYKSSKSGTFNMRLAAARLFGVIEGRGNDLSTTPLGERVVAPTYPQDAKAARVEAFLNIPIFRKVYEQFKGMQLPPDSGMQNHLRNEHGIPDAQTQKVLRILMDSAEQAHFFEARGGRSHLIRPLIQDDEDPPDIGGQDNHEDADEASESPPTSEAPSPPSSVEQVRLEYVRKLIGQVGSPDHEQDALMDRIERLLEKEAGH
ncbi:MAG: hypothetical protein OXG79_02420 [Chloroflexi bacterium]|nr:hypothetical protein [Chloroflexota bacterium]